MPRKHGEKGEYVETVTPEDVLEVFDTVRGPVVLSADVSDALGVTRETARRKLQQLYDRDDLDRRKVSRRVVYWRGEGAAHAPRAVESDDDAEAPGEGQTPSGDAHGGESDPLGDVISQLPSTVTEEDARKAIHMVEQYLDEEGPAPKAAIVRDVMPDAPLGYDPADALAKIEAGERYRGSWWRKVIKPGLEALPHISKPAPGASNWSHD